MEAEGKPREKTASSLSSALLFYIALTVYLWLLIGSRGESLSPSGSNLTATQMVLAESGGAQLKQRDMNVRKS